MRYFEVLEAVAAMAAQKRKRAREQLAQADRKRANAAHKYQDEVRASRSAAEQAKAKLQASNVVETSGAPKPLLERPRSYPLRNRVGTVIGWIEAIGRVLQAKDRNGSILGWYDPQTNQTRNRNGSIVGEGDFLSALVVTKGRL